jgi:hypothetical protein
VTRRLRHGSSGEPSARDGRLCDRSPGGFFARSGGQSELTAKCVNSKSVSVGTIVRAGGIITRCSLTVVGLARTRRQFPIQKSCCLRANIEHYPVDIWRDRGGGVIHHKSERFCALRSSRPMNGRARPRTITGISQRHHATVELLAVHGHHVRDARQDCLRAAYQPAPASQAGRGESGCGSPAESAESAAQSTQPAHVFSHPRLSIRRVLGPDGTPSAPGRAARIRTPPPAVGRAVSAQIGYLASANSRARSHPATAPSGLIPAENPGIGLSLRSGRPGCGRDNVALPFREPEPADLARPAVGVRSACGGNRPERPARRPGAASAVPGVTKDDDAVNGSEGPAAAGWRASSSSKGVTNVRGQYI